MRYNRFKCVIPVSKAKRLFQWGGLKMFRRNVLNQNCKVLWRPSGIEPFLFFLRGGCDNNQLICNCSTHGISKIMNHIGLRNKYYIYNHHVFCVDITLLRSLLIHSRKYPNDVVMSISLFGDEALEAWWKSQEKNFLQLQKSPYYDSTTIPRRGRGR